MCYFVRTPHHGGPRTIASVLKRSTRADCKTVAKANQAVLLVWVLPTGNTKYLSLIATTSKSIDFQSAHDCDRNVVKLNYIHASVLKRSTRADCKSADICLRRFESLPAHFLKSAQAMPGRFLLVRREVMCLPDTLRGIRSPIAVVYELAK
jgi:hypothetical protein